MDALFNVYKPRGPTSHDIVARLRRASGVRRIGHAGTLDPLAEGVLVVAVGQATRAIEYLADADKAYLARVTFGVETDTYDAEGRVMAERPIEDITPQRLEAALAAFRGPLLQRPPAYSAVSVGGRRLYDLARRGHAVEAPARPVEIARLELVSWAPPEAVLEVECSKGTYVRSLAHDLGQTLGCGAHLSGLIRTRVGRFLARDAVPLEDLEATLRRVEWQGIAIPVDQALSDLPAIGLDPAAAARLTNGLPVPAGGSDLYQVGTLGRAYGADGTFLAVVRRGEREGRPVWRPEKVFAPGASTG
jgi:tRNA pseudouridine55 synthase